MLAETSSRIESNLIMESRTVPMIGARHPNKMNCLAYLLIPVRSWEFAKNQ